jgi:AbrB family looped-hinge helix DNA binding protein
MEASVATNRAQMNKLTSGLSSKSEKMRVLASAGYQRGDIARFLGTSYQFVRNVLVQEEARRAGKGAVNRPANQEVRPDPNLQTNRARVGSAGEIILPRHIREAMGLSEGDALVTSLEDGELRLMTLPVAVRKAQAIVRKYVPEGVSLVDELLEDRRREVEREEQNG